MHNNANTTFSSLLHENSGIPISRTRYNSQSVFNKQKRPSGTHTPTNHPPLPYRLAQPTCQTQSTNWANTGERSASECRSSPWPTRCWNLWPKLSHSFSIST